MNSHGASTGAAHVAAAAPASALLIEGSGVARQLLERVLQSAFHAPVAVQVGVMPEDAPVDLNGLQLALVDIDLDDRAALILLNRLPPGCWRVVTTLYDEEDRLLPALQIGVHGYMLKQDRFERQMESLQRILRGCPEVSPAMARSLLDNRHGGHALDPIVERTLACVGKGSSLKETARTLNLGVEEVQAHLARVFEQMRRPAQTVLARLE